MESSEATIDVRLFCFSFALFFLGASRHLKSFIYVSIGTSLYNVRECKVVVHVVQLFGIRQEKMDAAKRLSKILDGQNPHQSGN